MDKDFDKYFSEVIGKGMNFTRNELALLKDSLKNSIQRWRIKGLIGKDEIPESSSRLIWEWKMDTDRDFTKKMVQSLAKRIGNYRRKLFGLKSSQTDLNYIAHMVNEMMKEPLMLRYPDQDLVDKFFRGKEIE